MLFCVVSIKHFTRECFLDDECKPLNQSAIPILFCVNNAKMKSRRLPTLHLAANAATHRLRRYDLSAANITATQRSSSQTWKTKFFMVVWYL